MGGQTGYGERNKTDVRSFVLGSGTNRSRKYPGIGRRNASVSLTAANRCARARLRNAAGSCTKARQRANGFGRSNESPNNTLSQAPAKAKKKCPPNRGHS